MKTIDKKLLKSNYYWECQPFYKSLPAKLPIPKKYFEKVNEKYTTEGEMVKWGEPFTKEEAFGLVCKLIKGKKDGWNLKDAFTIQIGKLPQLKTKSLISNPSDTLKLENFIKDIKEVIKKYE